MKVCSTCGHVYNADGWRVLPIYAYSVVEAPNGQPSALEMRTCLCKSTLTVHVPPSALMEIVRSSPTLVHRSAAETLIEILHELLRVAQRDLRLKERELAVAKSKAAAGDE